jgi:hypothetical protein
VEALQNLAIEKHSIYVWCMPDLTPDDLGSVLSVTVGVAFLALLMLVRWLRASRAVALGSQGASHRDDVDHPNGSATPVSVQNKIDITSPADLFLRWYKFFSAVLGKLHTKRDSGDGDSCIHIINRVTTASEGYRRVPR